MRTSVSETHRPRLRSGRVEVRHHIVIHIAVLSPAYFLSYTVLRVSEFHPLKIVIFVWVQMKSSSYSCDSCQWPHSKSLRRFSPDVWLGCIVVDGPCREGPPFSPRMWYNIRWTAWDGLNYFQVRYRDPGKERSFLKKLVLLAIWVSLALAWLMYNCRLPVHSESEPATWKKELFWFSESAWDDSIFIIETQRPIATNIQRHWYSRSTSTIIINGAWDILLERKKNGKKYKIKNKS